MYKLTLLTFVRILSQSSEFWRNLRSLLAFEFDGSNWICHESTRSHILSRHWDPAASADKCFRQYDRNKIMFVFSEQQQEKSGLCKVSLRFTRRVGDTPQNWNLFRRHPVLENPSWMSTAWAPTTGRRRHTWNTCLCFCTVALENVPKSCLDEWKR